MTERGTRATGSSSWGGPYNGSGMPPRPPSGVLGRRSRASSSRHQPLSARAAASSYSNRDEWLDDMLRASAEIAARLHAGARLDVPPSLHRPEPQASSPSSTFLTQTHDNADDNVKGRSDTRPVQRYVPEPDT